MTPLRSAAIALLATWFLFLDYLPPRKKVHLWSDIEGYHYPLLTYMHKSFREWRIPLWDPSIYCGFPFAGNIQAGLFYPPNWLLSLTNWRRDGISFLHIEILIFLHVTLALVVAWLWLRQRTRHALPAALGAAVVGLGGFTFSQMNHIGVFCGYAWAPLTLWGVEQASRTRTWRPLWKTVAGSTMCLLAGYPSTWVALVAIAGVYALALPWRTRVLPWTVAAIVVSIALCAVQLMPAHEAAQLKEREQIFGGGVAYDGFWPSFVFPNWYGDDRVTENADPGEGIYLYLGLPVVLGLLWLWRRPKALLPALAVFVVTVAVMIDRGGPLTQILGPLPVIPDLIRQWNFVFGIQIAAGLLTAASLDRLIPDAPSRPRWRWIWLGAVLAWSVYLIKTPTLAAGVKSGLYLAVGVPLLLLGLRMAPSRLQTAAVLLLVLADYHAFAINRRFNAVDGSVDVFSKGDERLGEGSLNGLDDRVYRAMRASPGYRVGIVTGPHSTDFRHYRLATPQGFDPLLPLAYKREVERFVPFTTNRLFEINPADERFLRHFGVRWILLRHESAEEARLAADPRFRMLEPTDSYFSVAEYRDAVPAWRFEAGNIRMTRWNPENRAFEVGSQSGGRLVLVEQFYPGWRARVDGRDVAIERESLAFQAVTVPPGDHTVAFDYEPLSFRAGAAISLITLTALIAYILKSR